MADITAIDLKRKFLRIKNSREMQSMDLSTLDRKSLLAIEDALSTLEKINDFKNFIYRTLQMTSIPGKWQKKK